MLRTSHRLRRWRHCSRRSGTDCFCTHSSTSASTRQRRSSIRGVARDHKRVRRPCWALPNAPISTAPPPCVAHREYPASGTQEVKRPRAPPRQHRRFRAGPRSGPGARLDVVARRADCRSRLARWTVSLSGRGSGRLQGSGRGRTNVPEARKKAPTTRWFRTLSRYAERGGGDAKTVPAATTSVSLGLNVHPHLAADCVPCAWVSNLQ